MTGGSNMTVIIIIVALAALGLLGVDTKSIIAVLVGSAGLLRVALLQQELR